MKHFLWCSLVFLVTLLFPLMVKAQSTTFIATDAAYVRAGSGAAMNFDTATAGNGLRVRCARVADNKRKSFLKFDFSGYTGVVGTATLNIWLDRALSTHYNPLTNQYPDTAVFFTVPNDNWSWHTITWNNAPDSGQYLFTHAFAHRASTQPDTLYTWDVTAFVRTKYAGNKQASFVLTDSDTSHDTDLRMFSLTTPFFEPFLDISPTTGVGTGSGTVPDGYELKQNYPNPFNPSTLIQYSVASEQLVRLDVYDVLGRTVATLVNEKKSPGVYSVPFRAADLGSGVYMYSLVAGSFRDTKRMVIVK